jgi:hypothetical protein
VCVQGVENRVAVSAVMVARRMGRDIKVTAFPGEARPEGADLRFYRDALWHGLQEHRRDRLKVGEGASYPTGLLRGRVVTGRNSPCRCRKLQTCWEANIPHAGGVGL